MSEAANNVPVTGKPFVGTIQEGLHRYCCSSYTIWSIQVSRVTGKFLEKHVIYILFSRYKMHNVPVIAAVAYYLLLFAPDFFLEETSSYFYFQTCPDVP